MEEPPVRFKVCGVTRAQDAELAIELGAWAIGMVFHPPSPRRCSGAAAAAIAAVTRRRAELVGVYVNAHLDELVQQADALRLTAIQLHGDEGPAYCAEVARRTGAQVIKAIRVRTTGDLVAVRTHRTVTMHLLDTAHPTLAGGTGEPWDWSMLERAPRGGPPRILSGGLTAANVAAAIAAVRPFAVDVASGVEASPGVKDHDKLVAFAAAVRDALPVAEAVRDALPVAEAVRDALPVAEAVPADGAPDPVPADETAGTAPLSGVVE